MAQGEPFSADLVAPAVVYVCKWLSRLTGREVVRSPAAPAQVEVRLAGSARRREPVVRDIDLVVALPAGVHPPSAAEGNAHMRLVRGGEVVQTWLYADALPVELYYTDHARLGAALLHTTGSREFNIWMRREAKKRGMRLSQWGLFKHDVLLAARTEADVFHALGIQFVPPWRRQGPPT